MPTREGGLQYDNFLGADGSYLVRRSYRRSCRAAGRCMRGAAKLPQGASTRAIAFELPDLLDKLKVSGLWFPDQMLPGAGLSGAAVFVFSNTETGETFSAAVNGMALLSPDYWKNHGVADPDNSNVTPLVDKLRADGIVEIRVSPETRAKIVDCGSNDLPSKQSVSGRDKCLTLGTAAVDFQDVDFDGTKDYVFRQVGQAQRFTDAYRVMDLPYDKLNGDKGVRTPLNGLDGWSEINISRRQIALHELGGACASAEKIYAQNPQADRGWNLVSYQRYATDAHTNACYLEKYTVKEKVEGESYSLKLISRKLVK